MIEMKYVVVAFEGKEHLFIFPKTISHDYYVESLEALRHVTGRDWERLYPEPISAGFTDGKICYGKSETLGISSRKQDADLLAYGTL
jgi:hypothetical protein